MSSVFDMIFDKFCGPSSDRYQLAATLNGHKGPINTLTFNAQATLLASGGDDEEVRVWDMNHHTLLQTLGDESRRWGQITCAKFLTWGGTASAAEWLYFGTGRGFFLTYRRPRKAGFVEHSSKRIFTAGDSVEAFDVDQNHQRIVLSSHNGKIILCNIDDGSIVEQWHTELLDVIPRSVRFVDSGRAVFIYGMETGALGDVSVCPFTGAIAVDNMKTGFDLYSANRINVTRTFLVRSTRKFVKKSTFGEGGKVLVCGSDHGAVYVYASSDGAAPLQVLKHGPQSHMIQTVEAAATQRDHIIASAASTGQYIVKIWKKKIPHTRGRFEQSDVPSLAHLFLLFLLAYLTMDRWFPMLEKQYNSIAAYTSRGPSPKNAEVVPGLREFMQKADLVDILTELEDKTARNLFNVDVLSQLRQSLIADEGGKFPEADGELQGETHQG